MYRRLPILLLSLFGTGCAFNNVPITLPTEGLQNTIAGGNGRQIVVIVPFTDNRAIRDRCGMMKNGYNMDTADAVCQSDPAQWIASLLADELRASGFEVLQPNAERRPGALRVDGSLLKIFIEPVIGAWTGSLEADLAISLHATSQTGLDATRKFFIKGWKGGVMAATAQPFHTALHRATQAILEEMVQSIVELMDRYPQLGSRSLPIFRFDIQCAREIS